MKAIVQERYGSPDDLELRDVEKPVVGDDEVLVRVQAASLGKTKVNRFIDDVPVISVSSELQRLREAADARPWSPNDINDVFFLTVALVYCDIVVTEKQWVDLAKRSRLDERFNTVLLSDLANLAPHLV